MSERCIDRQHTRDRVCKQCGGRIPTDTPYLAWLFHQCAYCSVEAYREYDAHHR